MCGRIFISICLIIAVVAGQAQARPTYKLFKSGNDFKTYGLFGGIGVVKAFAEDARISTQQITTTTSYDVIIDGQGKSAPFAEIGGFSVMRHGPIRMIDFGFSYRKVRGEEHTSALRHPGSDLSFPVELDATGTFVHHRTAFRMNFHFAIPLGKNALFHTGPGFDARLTIKLKEEYEAEHIDIETRSDVSSTSAAVNYLVGLGWKVGPGKYMDLYATSPLMNFERKGFNGLEPIFNTEYRLLTFGMRLMWLRATPDRSCPGTGAGRGARFTSTKSSGDAQPW